MGAALRGQAEHKNGERTCAPASRTGAISAYESSGTRTMQEMGCGPVHSGAGAEEEEEEEDDDEEEEEEDLTKWL